MSELPLKNDIEKYSFEILKGSKSLDVFPTPVDQIVEYAELVVRTDIDLSQIRESYFSKQLDVLKRALGKVRGALDRRQKLIYVDASQIKSRRNFVKLHEVGHDVLPWQKEVHDLLDDDDKSLSEDTHDEFEAEANYFASVTLFQHDRFHDELSKFGLGLDSSLQLAKHFGASVHATLRRYVEHSRNRCALIVLENISNEGAVAKCNIRNIFQSERFRKTFGEFILPIELGYTWEFVKDYYHKRRFKTDGIVNLPTENGESNFHYHFFYNSYNAFVFVFPLGEKKTTRRTIVIGGMNT